MENPSAILALASLLSALTDVLEWLLELPQTVFHGYSWLIFVAEREFGLARRNHRDRKAAALRLAKFALRQQLLCLDLAHARMIRCRRQDGVGRREYALAGAVQQADAIKQFFDIFFAY